jgi:hypothetical protein
MITGIHKKNALNPKQQSLWQVFWLSYVPASFPSAGWRTVDNELAGPCALWISPSEQDHSSGYCSGFSLSSGPPDSLFVFGNESLRHNHKSEQIYKNYSKFRLVLRLFCGGIVIGCRVLIFFETCDL